MRHVCNIAWLWASPCNLESVLSITRVYASMYITQVRITSITNYIVNAAIIVILHIMLFQATGLDLALALELESNQPFFCCQFRHSMTTEKWPWPKINLMAEIHNVHNGIIIIYIILWGCPLLHGAINLLYTMVRNISLSRRRC